MTKTKRKEERKLRTKHRLRERTLNRLKRRAQLSRDNRKRMEAAGYTYDRPTRTWTRREHAQD